ncbi:MAG TPA: hypothetical protein VMB03_11690 [Bryobacteraceae bacterium]|nr:hypothetical protein [Bryobacteraceae bacterium]
MKKIALWFLAAGALVAISAAPSSIGFVRSAGDFRVDGSLVRGNSTIFDGDTVETAASRSVVQLSGGQLTLAPESRAKIYHDRTVLEKGTGMLRDAATQVLQADSLAIAPAAKGAVVQVDVKSASRVSVYAFAGNAQVRNSSGLLLANLHSGMALDFDNPPQAGGSTAVKLTGMVSEQGGNYFITDSTTNTVAQIQGKDLAKLVGKRVTVNGSLIPDATPATGATEVVSVASAQVVGAGAGAATATGLAVGAKVAIIGGIAVAGTVGGLAAAGTFSSSTTSPK